jgi:aminoglycoside phosphotransferase (APT) family kinase protein
VTDPSVIRALVDEQFPAWADRPLDPRPAGAGSDHVVHRLGIDLAVRLPLRADAAAQVGVEQRWLPRLAAALPVPIPAPVGHGRPGRGVPWPWSVVRWLPGVDATRATVTDHHALARDLAAVVRALWSLPPEGPAPGPRNGGRGAPLATRVDELDAAVADLRADPEPGIDLAAALDRWRDALAAPPHAGPPRWAHGDLLPGNLLVTDGRLGGVVDFGCCGVGDPAVDLLPAWAVLPTNARATFRDALEVDDATWRRGRGWAVSFGLIALPYHRTRTPDLARVAHRAVVAATGDA